MSQRLCYHAKPPYRISQEIKEGISIKSYFTILTDSLSVKVVALFQMFKATFIESHVEIPSFIS
jgi:hypothetical protein